MGLNTKISWTQDADGALGATWNPLVGCHPVSPGCDNCYARTVVNRFAGKNKAFPNRFDVVTIRDDSHLLLPLSVAWQKQPLRIFVNSLSDLFHDDVPAEFIARVFAVMASCPQHTFQLLTKRPGRMRSVLRSEAFAARYAFEMGALVGDRLIRQKMTADRAPTPDLWPLPQVWGGVSAEDQRWAGIRIPVLLDTPLAVRWVSLEPLLAPLTLFGDRWDLGCEETGPAVTHEGYQIRTDYGTGTEWGCDHQAGIDWVVVGGESGAGARRMDPGWARALRDECAAADVPFFMKQLGSVLAREMGVKGKGDRLEDMPPDLRVQQFPSPAAVPVS